MTQDPAEPAEAAADLHLRLDRLSKAMGVASTDLVTHALEQWVAEQERALALIEALAQDVGGEMGPRLKTMLHTGLFLRQQTLQPLALRSGEVAAVAAAEHLTTGAAAGLGSALLRSRAGVRQLERMIVDQIDHAREAGDDAKADALAATLERFLAGGSAAPGRE
jgi:predicted transcriptional regulator